MAKKSFVSKISKNMGGLVRKSLLTTLLLAVVVGATVGSFSPNNQATPHDNIIIQGSVRNLPHGGFPNTQITAKNNRGQIIATANTNSQGQYTLSIISTDIHQLPQTDINRVFPNPFSDNTNLIFTPQHTGIYTLRITDLQGRTLLAENHQIASQESVNFQISGLGIPGTYIATIQGSHEQATFRIIQTTTNHQRSVTVTRNAQTKSMKNTPPANNLILEYISQGHLPSDTTLTWASHTNVNKTLQVTPDTIIAPYTIIVNNNRGLLVNNAQITVKPNQQTTPILQGTTNPEGRFQGNIQQIQWTFQGDTIKTINQLNTNIEAAQHQSRTRIDQFANPINLADTLIYIPILQYTINLNLTSTNQEKTPLRFRGYILHQNDTLTAQNFTGTQGTLTIQHTEPTLNVTIGARNIPHFQPTTNNTTITPTTNNATINTTPIIFTYDITGEVRHQNNNPAQATVSTQGRNTNTNTQGQYTLQDIIRNTDQNNAPLTYNTTITATGNFETQTRNITVTGQNQTINFTVPNPPPPLRNVNFTFKPITINGDPQHPDNKIHVRLGNHTETVTVGNQTSININITTHTHDNHITMWDEPPVNTNNEPLYNDVLIIHTQNRQWHEPPIKNNHQTALRTRANQPFDTLTLDINQIHNRHNLEAIKMYNYFDHPEPTVGRIYTNSLTTMRFMTSRSGEFIMGHEPTPNGWTILFKTYDEANNLIVPPAFINNWTSALTQTLNASTRNDGQRTFNWEIIYIHTRDDPRYVAAVNNNWRNTLIIEPHSAMGSAHNAVSGGFTHHMWGRGRTPPFDTDISVAFEEIVEPTYRFSDPIVGWSTRNFILTGPRNNPVLNEYAIRAIRYRQQLSHRTRFDYIVR